MEKTANVIILAGQSNAVGVGFTKYLNRHFSPEQVAKFYEGYENVVINYRSHGIVSNGFVKTTVNCTEKAKDTLGPEVGIAKNLTKRYPNEKFFIVKCAFGGATICNDWLSPSNEGVYDPTSFARNCPDIVKALESGKHPKAGWCYNELVELLTESIDILKKEDYEPKIRAMFWMQGESDSYAKELVENYIPRYDMMIKDLQRQFSGLFSGCIFVDAGISKRWLNYEELNAFKKEYAEKEGHRYIDTIKEGLTTEHEPLENPDTAHYDADSIVKLGELFAEKLIF